MIIILHFYQSVYNNIVNLLDIIYTMSKLVDQLNKSIYYKTNGSFSTCKLRIIHQTHM